MFPTNVGTADKAVRVAIGVALLAWWFLAPGMGWRWVPLVLAIVALATAATATCPLYTILGINTCGRKKP